MIIIFYFQNFALTTTKLLLDGKNVQQFKDDFVGSRKILKHFPDWASHNRRDASKEQLSSHSFLSDQWTSKTNYILILDTALS